MAVKQTEVRYLTGPQVRKRYGGLSDMTLWRWVRDDEADPPFPKPITINRRNFWLLSEIEAYEAELKARSAA